MLGSASVLTRPAGCAEVWQYRRHQLQRSSTLTFSSHTGPRVASAYPDQIDFVLPPVCIHSHPVCRSQCRKPSRGSAQALAINPAAHDTVRRITHPYTMRVHALGGRVRRASGRSTQACETPKASLERVQRPVSHRPPQSTCPSRRPALTIAGACLVAAPRWCSAPPRASPPPRAPRAAASATRALLLAV